MSVGGMEWLSSMMGIDNSRAFLGAPAPKPRGSGGNPLEEIHIEELWELVGASCWYDECC